MINYYFKYLELLDTVFLALKKKPLGVFLCCSFSITLLSLTLKLFYMFSITLQRQCYVLHNLMERPAWYVPLRVCCAHTY